MGIDSILTLLFFLIICGVAVYFTALVLTKKGVISRSVKDIAQEVVTASQGVANIQIAASGNYHGENLDLWTAAIARMLQGKTFDMRNPASPHPDEEVDIDGKKQIIRFQSYIAFNVFLDKLKAAGFMYEEECRQGTVDGKDAVGLKVWKPNLPNQPIFVKFERISSIKLKSTAAKIIYVFNEASYVSGDGEIEAATFFVSMYDAKLAKNGEHPIKFHDIEECAKASEFYIGEAHSQNSALMHRLVYNESRGSYLDPVSLDMHWSIKQEDANYAANFIPEVIFQEGDVKSTNSGLHAWRVFQAMMSATKTDPATGMLRPDVRSVIITGAAGTGKSQLVRAWISWAAKHLNLHFVLASSDILRLLSSSESSANIRNAFESDKNYVLVFDDVDTDKGLDLKALIPYIDSSLAAAMPWLRGVIVATNTPLKEISDVLYRTGRCITAEYKKFDAPGAVKLVNHLTDSNPDLKCDLATLTNAARNGITLAQILSHVIGKGSTNSLRKIKSEVQKEFAAGTTVELEVEKT